MLYIGQKSTFPEAVAKKKINNLKSNLKSTRYGLSGKQPGGEGWGGGSMNKIRMLVWGKLDENQTRTVYRAKSKTA